METHGATWQVRSTTGVFYSVVLSRHDDDTHSINYTVQNLCHWVPSPCPHPLLAVAPRAGCHRVENTTEHNNTRCSERKTVHPNRTTGTHVHMFPPIKRSLQQNRSLWMEVLEGRHSVLLLFIKTGNSEYILHYYSCACVIFSTHLPLMLETSLGEGDETFHRTRTHTDLVHFGPESKRCLEMPPQDYTRNILTWSAIYIFRFHRQRFPGG